MMRNPCSKVRQKFTNNRLTEQKTETKASVFERILCFFLVQKKIYLFLPLPFREKSERPEKAHSSLCSQPVNLDNSHDYSLE